jgi:hypothetical protein
MKLIQAVIAALSVLLGSDAFAAIACSLLTNGNGGADPTTASISPTNNALVLVGIESFGASAPPTSVSGNDITYALVDNTPGFNNGGGDKNLYLYRGMAASPTSGAIAIDSNGSFTEWVVAECTGVVTGNNGADAVVQADDATVTPGTSITPTLASFASANNASFAVYIGYGSTALSAEMGFTVLYDGDAADEPSAMYLATSDNTPTVTFSSEYVGIVGIEIAAASSGGTGVAKQSSYQLFRPQ